MQTETNRSLVTRVFPRFKPVTCIYFEFSLVPCAISLGSDWAAVITLLLVSRHSIEKRSRSQCNVTDPVLFLLFPELLVLHKVILVLLLKQRNLLHSHGSCKVIHLYQEKGGLSLTSLMAYYCRSLSRFL